MAAPKFDGWHHLIERTYIRAGSWATENPIVVAHREGNKLVDAFSGKVMASNDTPPNDQ